MNVIISIDTEALQPRAKNNHVQRLIYGETPEGVYGIKRLCELFDSFGIKAVFFVDFAECKLYGNDIIDAARLIKKLGHDVQLHFHPEIYFNDKNKTFDKLCLEESIEALKYGIDKYVDAIGNKPYAFRAGGFMFNRECIQALQYLKINLSTNVLPAYRKYDHLYFDSINGIVSPFFWFDNLKELPVDIPIPELSTASFNNAIPYINQVIKQKKLNSGVLNIVLHSWSLIERDTTTGYHTKGSSEYLQNLTNLLSLIANAGANFLKYDDISNDFYNQNIDIKTTNNIRSYIDMNKSNTYPTVAWLKLLKVYNLTPNHEPVWIDVDSTDCTEVNLNAITKGGSCLSENKCLVIFKFSNDIKNPKDYGLVKSDIVDIGYYRYLNTGSGSVHTKLTIPLPFQSSLTKIGIRSWYPDDNMFVEELEISLNSENKLKDLNVSESAFIYGCKSGAILDNLRSKLPVLQYLTDLESDDVYQLVIKYGKTNNEESFVFKITNDKAFVFSKIRFLSAMLFKEITEYLFLKFQKLDEIIFEDVFISDLNDFGEESFNIKSSGSSYILDLPKTFDDYQDMISSGLRYDIKREYKRFSEQNPSLKIDYIISNNITLDYITDCATIIDNHIKRKLGTDQLEWYATNSVSLNYENYKNNGLVVSLVCDGQIFASAIFLLNKETNQAHLIAAGHRDDLTKYSLGKIVLYESIRILISFKIKLLILGGGDFGYKERFGAISKLYYNLTVSNCNSPESNDEHFDRFKLLKFNITRGQNRVEVHLGKNIYPDFDSIVEPSVAGLPSTSYRYQPINRAVFDSLLSSIERNSNDVFVDIGCGKGKALMFASNNGLNKCIGIELSYNLYDICLSNMRNLSCESDILLLNVDALNLDFSSISEANIFFLYNPFNYEITNRFATNFAKSRNLLSSKKIFLIYANSLYQECFELAGFKLVQKFVRGENNWNFDSSSIFTI